MGVREKELHGKVLDSAITIGNIAQMFRINGKPALESRARFASDALHDLAGAIKDEYPGCFKCKDTGQVVGVDGNGSEASGPCEH